MSEERRATPRITKKIGVIDAPNFLKFTGDSGEYSENRLRMVPIVFTSDRELIGRTLEVMTDCGGRAEVVFENVEELVRYVPSVNVSINKDAPLKLSDLVVRPTIVVMDKSLAEALGVVIRDRTLQYAKIAEVGR